MTCVLIAPLGQESCAGEDSLAQERVHSIWLSCFQRPRGPIDLRYKVATPQKSGHRWDLCIIEAGAGDGEVLGEGQFWLQELGVPEERRGLPVPVTGFQLAAYPKTSWHLFSLSLSLEIVTLF